MGLKDEFLKAVNDIVAMLLEICDSIMKLLSNFWSDLRAARIKIKDLYKTNYELGLYHFDAGHYGDAIFRFKMLHLFFPDRVTNDSNYYMGQSYIEKYNYRDGVKCLNAYLNREPDGTFSREARFSLAFATHSVGVDECIPIDIVKRVFDTVATEYDKKNIIGRTKFPQHTLFEMLRSELDKGDHRFANNILDLGCGTGYIGRMCRQSHLASVLVGIDASREMIKIAGERECDKSPSYSELVNEDIESYFTYKRLKSHSKYDVVIASNLLPYYSDVEKLFSIASAVSCKEAVLCVSFMITAQNHNREFSYPHKCFLFSEEYIKCIGKKKHWRVVQSANVTYQNGMPGLVILFRKASSITANDQNDAKRNIE